MLSTTPFLPHARTAARTVAVLLVAAATFAGPAAVASTVTSPPATPTVSHTPRPVVSPFAGPLATPCPPSAAAHPAPEITSEPSAEPTTAAVGPIGGPALGSSGVVVGDGAPSVPDITAASWVVADADTGEILGAKDPHGRFLPASTLKTLTAVTLIPRLDPCAIYTATKKDLHAECTCAGVADGTAYRIKMLFTGMLIYSGNDAANTLAGAYGGIDKTVAAMNAEAKYLKAYDTEAGTPSGLDTPGERSSAYDLALIARAGLAMPDFRSYVSTRHVLFTMPHGKTQTLFTHVKLLPNYDGAIGIKNGFTVAAQATYVGAATRNGHTIIATLMHSTVGTQVWHEDAALLDWGFAAEKKAAAPVGQLVDPDLPPVPSVPASSATTSSAGGATSGTAAATSVLKSIVKASDDTHKASASGASVALPLGIAGVVAVGAAGTLATLQRRRRRRSASLEKALRF